MPEAPYPSDPYPDDPYVFIPWARELGAQTAGPVLTHGDPEFDAAIRLHTAALPGHPAAVLRARTVTDISTAVLTASHAGVPLSVRGGGHSAAAHAVAVGGLMLDLSTLRAVRVDPGRATATAEPGVTWGAYDRATQEHGLAGTGGSVSTTGVAGLTLGGGIGALRGLHGLAADHLVAADVVLADGSVVRADATRETELFWALRGGGGNFGVVVGFHLALHPVTRMVTGALTWPLDRIRRLAAAYRALAGRLADHTVAEFVLGHAPSGNGAPTVTVIPRVIGGPDEAAPVLAALRAGGGSPLADTVRERSYVEGQRFMDAATGWGARHYWSTCTLRHLDDEVVGVLAAHAARAPSARCAVTVEHLHGAVSRVPAPDTAVGFRHAPYNVRVEAMWSHPADDAPNRAWAQALIAALRPFAAGGAYVNYLPRDATSDDVRAAYGVVKYARLQRAKAAYDPANLFRTNQNIPPQHAR